MLDALLPDVDGFELAATLRHDPQTSAIPIWLTTPGAMAPEAKARLNGNVQGVLDARRRGDHGPAQLADERPRPSRPDPAESEPSVPARASRPARARARRRRRARPPGERRAPARGRGRAPQRGAPRRDPRPGRLPPPCRAAISPRRASGSRRRRRPSSCSTGTCPTATASSSSARSVAPTGCGRADPAGQRERPAARPGGRHGRRLRRLPRQARAGQAAVDEVSRLLDRGALSRAS